MPARTLFDELIDRGTHFVGGVLVERLQRDVADVVAEHARVRHGRNVHDATREVAA